MAAPARWPIVGERLPAASDQPWSLTIAGLVQSGRCWSLDQLQSLPQLSATVDIHCVTRWSKPCMQWSGVLLERLLDAVGVLPEAKFVSLIARSARQHSTSVPLADALSLGAIVALGCQGQPLEIAHGGPIRLVMPGRYFYKSLKWLQRIELLQHDRLGHWEATAGYHNGADPWAEQRYLASDLDRRQVAQLLVSRNLAGRELRGFDAAGHTLIGLNARAALLRDANFSHTDLQRSCFDGANLSNAHLPHANLQGASLVNADLEGADFTGADLRGANFNGAFLTAATFVSPDWPAPAAHVAKIDAQTQFDSAALQQLMPQQAEFLSRALDRPLT